jgi:hypothetical protein
MLTSAAVAVPALATLGETHSSHGPPLQLSRPDDGESRREQEGAAALIFGQARVMAGPRAGVKRRFPEDPAAGAVAAALRKAGTASHRLRPRAVTDPRRSRDALGIRTLCGLKNQAGEVKG